MPLADLPDLKQALHLTSICKYPRLQWNPEDHGPRPKHLVQASIGEFLKHGIDLGAAIKKRFYNKKAFFLSINKRLSVYQKLLDQKTCIF